MNILEDLVYRNGPDSRNRGDLFLPDSRRPETVLMLIHGGGWDALDRTSIRGIATQIAARTALPVWTPDYRLIHHSPWPACLDDLESAARWILESGSVPLGDPPKRRMAVGGFSAGGHLALMLGLTRKVKRLCCLISVAGPTLLAEGLPTISRDISRPEFSARFFGKNPTFRDRRSVSPVCRVNGKGLPPLLLIHSREDRLVPPVHSLAMSRRYKARGGNCRCVFFHGNDPYHGLWLRSRTVPRPARKLNPRLVEAVHAFLSRKLP